MMKFVVFRLLLMVCFVVISVFTTRNLRPTDLSPPAGREVVSDNCVVSEEAAQVHYKDGKKNYENAWIQYVNDDSTVQVSTVETKLSFLFWVHPDRIKCFRSGSLAQVTVIEWPDTVYVRTEAVDVLKWKYSDDAP